MKASLKIALIIALFLLIGNMNFREVQEANNCVAQDFYSCPEGYFNDLVTCEIEKEKVDVIHDRIPKDIDNYIKYVADKISPNDLNRGKIIVYIILILFLFSPDIIKPLKKLRLKKKW